MAVEERIRDRGAQVKMRTLNSRQRRASGCKGKRRWDGFTEARNAASSAARNNGEAMAAYHCSFCHGFHIGGSRMEAGRLTDSRQPFRVFAHNGDGVECFIGRSPDQAAAKLREILDKDGWTVTRVVEGRR
jgi:hypothetical protein